jgi:hypothetical protein
MTDHDQTDFREQAEYCRRQANRAHDPKDKEAWLKVAGDWLQMAEEGEKRKRQA